MLATLVLLASLVQDRDSQLFLWRIEGLGEPTPLIAVIVEPTPFGLTQKADVKAISLKLLPTASDPKPRAVAPIKTETTAAWGLRAYFHRPRGRFNLTVTFRDGSTRRIDIYRQPPRSDQPKPYTVEPWRGIAPYPGRWTRHDGRSGLLQPTATTVAD